MPVVSYIQPPDLPPILLKNDKTYWISQPQLIRWRNRYRGVIESAKINLEMQQILYDLRRISERTTDAENLLESNLNNIEYGASLNGTFLWSSTNTLAPVTIPGTNDFIRRLNALQVRIKSLETHSWLNRVLAFNDSI